MIKKSVFILFSSLIISGLLLVGSAKAMTYTVEGTTTKIAIPKSIEGTSIKWCASCDSETVEVFSGAATQCEERNDDGFDALVCEHNYENTGPHTITYDGKSKSFENLSLNSSNTTNISNFSKIGDVTNIYIKDNSSLSSFNMSIFPSGVINIHLENNALTSFNGDIPYSTKKLYLNNNGLETIPDNVWEKRGSYTIKLGSVKYPNGGSDTKLIDLSDNPINFIGITEIDNSDYINYIDGSEKYEFHNTNNYRFEWFGYSGGASSLTYDYEILNEDGTAETDQSSTLANINTYLKPGDYTFKVCIHDTTTCDTVDFKVSYTVNVNFKSPTYPNSGETVTSIDGIQFYWEKTGYYPEVYLSGYTYTLEKDSSTIYSKNDPVPLSSTGYVPTLPTNPNGNYTFTVNLVNNGGPVATATRTFTVAIDDTLTIEKPLSSYTGAGVTTVSIPLKWSTPSSLFDHYSYYITTNGSCSPTNIVQSGNNITANPFETSVDLGDGNYFLCVTMHASNGNKDLGKSFSVNIPSTIQITSPANLSDIKTAEIPFTWEGFTPYTLTNYTYELLDEHSNTITGGSTTSTGFKYINLPDGDYTFTVTLNDNSGKPAISDTVTFTVSASAGKGVNIIRPKEGNHTGENVTGVNINFYWEGTGTTLFHHYKYTLKNGNNIIKEGTTNVLQSGSFDYVLPSGEYTFYVDMLDSGDKPIISGYRNFTVVIPTTLTIDKPTPGLQNSKDIEFNWTGFAEFFGHYQYTLSGWDGATLYTGKTNVSRENNHFEINNLHHGQYRFTVNMIKTGTTDTIITGKYVDFGILDDIGLVTNIYQDDTTAITSNTIKSRTGTFSWYGQSEDFSGYYYSISGTTFTGAQYVYTGTEFGNTSGSVVLNDLSSGIYQFVVKMLSGPNVETDVITGKTMDFNVAIPATITITSPTSGSTIKSSSATFSWTGYSDVITRYDYKISSPSYNIDTNNFTTSTSFSRNDLKDGNYTLTVWISSGGTLVAEDTINFSVAVPVPPAPTYSSKTHQTNNLKLSVGNESPTANEWIELIININEKYTGKVSFPKIQYYSGDTEKWIDIPITSKNFISDYSDDAKLGYVKFTSDDKGQKQLPQFIKFSKNGNYRIYAEDKDGDDTYVQLRLGPKNDHGVADVEDIIKEIIDDEEEVYIARSCKKYTIRYYETLNVYTSPNLNMSEYFMNKAYFKRYIDSKNRYQSGCPTNIGWISTTYVDRTDDDERYTAPNGKVYFIIGEEGNYYSEELNKELKTPTSFNTIKELKYYIRDRNPLISMATLGPIN